MQLVIQDQILDPEKMLSFAIKDTRGSMVELSKVYRF